MTLWYYVQFGQRQGPVSAEFIAGEMRRGRLTLEDRAWCEGMEDWKAIAELPELADLATHTPPRLPAATPPPVEPGAPILDAAAATVYAPVHLRAAALLIDGAVLSIPLLILAFLVVAAAYATQESFDMDKPDDAAWLRFVYQLCALPWLWLYNAGFESSAFQATPGKRAMGLQVTGTDGERLSFGRASLRFVFKDLTLWFGFVLALDLPLIGYRSPQKQALHDVLAKTVVILKRPRLDKKEGTTT